MKQTRDYCTRLVVRDSEEGVTGVPQDVYANNLGVRDLMRYIADPNITACWGKPEFTIPGGAYTAYMVCRGCLVHVVTMLMQHGEPVTVLPYGPMPMKS